MLTFSVILATRNRPALFGRALESVTNQSCNRIEIIVVNDGSDEAHLAEYRALVEAAPKPVQFHSLVRRPNGHGQSYAVNFGAACAAGEYLCFLDDDDLWTDSDYLCRIQHSIEKRADAPDLIFSSQAAFFDDQRKEGPIWLEGLADRLANLATPEECGLYRVSVDELVNSGGFCHMNTMVVRSALFDAVGGMDEGIRWECDHDLFLRLVDRAETMLLSPMVVARHNIPDPARAASMTTSLSQVDRRLYQVRVFDKGVLFATKPAVKAHSRLGKGYVLKHIAESLAAEKDYRTALFYALQALGAAPGLKWAGYTGWLLLTSMYRNKKPRT